MTALDAALPQALAWLQAGAVVCCRLVPVAFLCPLFGGAAAPLTVRLGVVLALGAWVTTSLGGPALAPGGALDFAIAAGREATLGLVVGLVAGAPFDMARAGGRFADLLRGSSAEAALPHAGSRESATGDLLYQLLVAIAASGPAMALVLQGLARSYAVLPPGNFTSTGSAVALACRVGLAVLGTAVAVAAPTAAAALSVDLVLGLVGRVAPGLAPADAAAGLRLLAGGVALWLGLGGAAVVLLGELAAAAGTLVDLGRVLAP